MTDMLTREELLRRAGFGAAMLSIPGLAAACGGSSGGGEASGTTQKLASTLRFANWPLYIDVDEKTKKHPTLEPFTKKTGVKVDYTEDINSNSEYFGKIQGPLSRGQSINEDIIVLTDNERYLSLMIDKGWVEELDKDAIPNIINLVDVQQHPGFDPDRKYSLPWQSGMTGIAYNPKLTKPILSIDQLLEDKSLKGQITVLNSFADTLGLVMLSNGDDPSKVTDASFKSALDRIKAASDNGQIRQFTGNDYAGPLSKGDLKACVAWSGDIVQLQAGQPRPEMEHPRGRRDDLDGQHDHPEGRRRVHGLGVHELRLHPGRRGEDRRLRPVRDAGEGRQRGRFEGRPGAGGERADLPVRRDAREGAPDRPGRAQEPELQRAVAGRARRLTRTWAVGFFHRHRGLTPYLLLFPGMAWLAIFFLVPLGFLGISRFSPGRSTSATPSTGPGATTGTRSSATTRGSSARSSTRAWRR